MLTSYVVAQRPRGSGPSETQHNISHVTQIQSFADVSLVQELDIVDNENIPHEGGIMFVSTSKWIDRSMLLHASLPGKLSILAKHTLFDMPIIGRMIRGGGGLPIYRAKDSDNVELAKSNNAAMLENAGTEIANGGRLLLFPKEELTLNQMSAKPKLGLQG